MVADARYLDTRGQPDSVMGVSSSMAAAARIQSFYFKEYAAPEGCATDDRRAWRIANPALHPALIRSR